MKATHEITCSHCCYYVNDLRTGEKSVGFFRSLSAAVRAFPNATINVPVAVKKTASLAD